MLHIAELVTEDGRAIRYLGKAHLKKKNLVASPFYASVYILFIHVWVDIASTLGFLTCSMQPISKR